MHVGGPTNHRKQHARQTHVRPELGCALDQRRHVRGGHWAPEVRHHRAQRNTPRYRTRRGLLSQLTELERIPGGRVDDLVALGSQPGRRHAPPGRSRRDQHLPRGCANPPELVDVLADASGPVGVLVAVAGIPPRLLHHDAAVVSSKLGGDDPRQRRSHPLPHLRAVALDGHGAVGLNPDKHVGLERRRGRMDCRRTPHTNSGNNASGAQGDQEPAPGDRATHDEESATCRMAARMRG